MIKLLKFIWLHLTADCNYRGLLDTWLDVYELESKHTLTK
jgi:hypothetical protein